MKLPFDIPEPEHQFLTEMTFLTVDQVAELLQCSSRHVYRLEERGRLPRAARLGSSVRWPRHAIEDWISNGCKAIISNNSQQ